MDTLQTTIKKFLDKKKWQYQESVDNFVIGIESEDKRFMCSMHFVETTKILIFYAHFPYPMEPKKIKMLLSHINTLNANIAVGNFEMETNKNVLRCRTSIDLENIKIDFGLIDNMINANLTIFLQNYDTFLFAIKTK